MVGSMGGGGGEGVRGWQGGVFGWVWVVNGGYLGCQIVWGMKFSPLPHVEVKNTNP